MSEKQLIQDSENRGIRTFIQGVTIDIAVGVALVLTTFFASTNSWGEVEWIVLSFSVFKSVVQAIAAYIMRRWLDRSKISTPLPPVRSGEPAE